MTTIDDCVLLDLPMIGMPEGNITPVEGGHTIPFEIERAFYLYDVLRVPSAVGMPIASSTSSSPV